MALPHRKLRKYAFCWEKCCSDNILCFCKRRQCHGGKLWVLTSGAIALPRFCSHGIEVEYNTITPVLGHLCNFVAAIQTWPWWVWRHWFSEFCDILEWTLTPDSAGWIQMTCNLTISGKNGSIILSCHQHQPRQKGMGVPVLVYWSLFAPAFY